MSSATQTNDELENANRRISELEGELEDVKDWKKICYDDYNDEYRKKSSLEKEIERLHYKEAKAMSEQEASKRKVGGLTEEVGRLEEEIADLKHWEVVDLKQEATNKSIKRRILNDLNRTPKSAKPRGVDMLLADLHAMWA